MIAQLLTSLRKQWRSERGQAIIQVTISLVALLAMVALAIDVGRVYGERRQMQNAADAGALAGARELCLGNGKTAAENKAARVHDRQWRTGSQYICPRGCESQSRPNKRNHTAHNNVQPLIGQVAGWLGMDVPATAQAVCGAARSACGLWPLAFDKTMWQQVAVKNGSCNPVELIVWNDDKDVTDHTCKVGGVPQDNLCGCYKCDQNGDGKDDFVVTTTAGRGWLDLSEVVAPYSSRCKSNGCGAAELSCMLERNSGAKVTVPACISGTKGVKAGVKSSVDSRAGDSVSIALFDGTGCTTANCSVPRLASSHSAVLM